jgi:hypothetical protein
MWRMFVVLFAGCATRPVAWDLATGCSSEHNPNGVWQFGHSALAPETFQRDHFHQSGRPFGFWQPAENAHFPYVVCSQYVRTTVYGKPGNGWAVRPGQVAMEAANDGRYSVVRFTAPEKGHYKVSARFEGIHFMLSTTDVHVMHGATSLFAAEVEGYGGDPASWPISGANPTGSYEGMVDLSAGDTLDFAVGYGRNLTDYGDTTGLFARVERVRP